MSEILARTFSFKSSTQTEMSSSLTTGPEVQPPSHLEVTSPRASLPVLTVVPMLVLISEWRVERTTALRAESTNEPAESTISPISTASWSEARYQRKYGVTFSRKIAKVIETAVFNKHRRLRISTELRTDEGDSPQPTFTRKTRWASVKKGSEEQRGAVNEGSNTDALRRSPKGSEASKTGEDKVSSRTYLRDALGQRQPSRQGEDTRSPRERACRRGE